MAKTGRLNRDKMAFVPMCEVLGECSGSAILGCPVRSGPASTGLDALDLPYWDVQWGLVLLPPTVETNSFKE